MWPFSPKKTEEAVESFDDTRALDLVSEGGVAWPGGALSQAGVTAHTALESPTTLSAVRAISETVGAIPLHTYRRADNNGRDRAPDHPSTALLSRRANPWTGPAELRTRLVFDALLHGRGVAIVSRVNGEPRELHRVEPHAVAVDMTSGEPVYRITTGRETREYPWRDVVDVLTPGSAVDRPLCLTLTGREAIATDILMARYWRQLMRKGARPGAVLSADNDAVLSPTAFDNVLKLIKKQATGDRAGETLVLPGRFKYTPQVFSSVDMQFTENHEAAKNEIARIFRVPPTILQDYSRAVWRNLEESAQSWLAFGLLPWFEAVEFAFSRALIAEDERDDVFLEHQLAELTRPNTLALYNAGRTATGSAVMTANEWRRVALNLPPIEGGDELVRQAGQTGATGEDQGGPTDAQD